MFFYNQKTAYEMRMSDWSSDVCSSDLLGQYEKLRARNPPRRCMALCADALFLVSGGPAFLQAAVLPLASKATPREAAHETAAGPCRENFHAGKIGRAHV